MNYSARDVEIMTATLYGEARGSTYADQEAIAWVIRNRADIDIGRDGKPDWWGEGIAGVCLAPWQFSCHNESDPNRAVLRALTLPAALSDPAYRSCLRAALTVLGTRSGAPVPLVGVTHYFVAKMAPPAWTKGATCVGAIGAHLFYRDVR